MCFLTVSNTVHAFYLKNFANLKHCICFSDGAPAKYKNFKILLILITLTWSMAYKQSGISLLLTKEKTLMMLQVPLQNGLLARSVLHNTPIVNVNKMSEWYMSHTNGNRFLNISENDFVSHIYTFNVETWYPQKSDLITVSNPKKVYQKFPEHCQISTTQQLILRTNSSIAIMIQNVFKPEICAAYVSEEK